MGEPPDGGFSSRLERMEDRLGARMEARMEARVDERMDERMDDRVEVYEAQLDPKYYHGFAPTAYNYQVQSKAS